MTMRLQYTIARGIGLIAIIAINAALIRSFFVQEMFCGLILIFFALQVGLGCLFRSRGRSRRFWLGFETAGAMTVLSLFASEIFPDLSISQMLIKWLTWHTNIAAALAWEHLPSPLYDSLFDDYNDLFLAVIDFLPELFTALLGGFFAACLFSKANGQRDSTTKPLVSLGEDLADLGVVQESADLDE